MITAIITLIENIEKAIDKKLFVCAISIDLQKAFDTVDHNILLQKLHHFGIRDLANNYLFSYLSNRKQMDLIMQHKFLDMMYHNDQPSPHPFLIYITDLHNSIKRSQPLNLAKRYMSIRYSK